MKKSLYLVLCFVLAIAMFVSCDDVEHTHTFAEEWSSNSTGHWYAATCEHTDELGSYAAHADENNDGICDVCYWEDTTHIHTYSPDWSSDAEYHWKVPTCEHTGIEVSGKDAHADEDKNGICDDCEYVTCAHDYAPEWDMDDNYHWHNATCGCEVNSGYGAHVDDDLDYACDDCGMFMGEVDETNLLALLRAANAKRGNLNGTSILYCNIDGSITQIDVELGANDTYSKYTYTTRNTYMERWFENLGNGNVFAVVSYDGGDIDITTGSIEEMSGYNYNPSTITSADTIENLLYNLVELSATAENYTVILPDGTEADTYTVSHDVEANTVSMAFWHLFVNPVTVQGVTTEETDLFYVELVFEYTDDFNIVSAELLVDAYSSINLKIEVGEDVYENSALDYVYDSATKVVTMESTATNDRYLYSITQTVGERTFENPYSKSVILPSDFDLCTDQERTQAASESVDAYVGNFVEFYMHNITPSTALYQFITSEDMTLSVVYADNGEAYNSARYYFAYSNYVAPSDGFEGSVDDNWAAVYVNPDALGRDLIFTLTYHSPDGSDIVKTIKINVKEVEAEEVNKNVSGTSFEVTTTDTYSFVDKFIYTAAEAGTYTFNLPDGLGFALEATVVEEGTPEVDPFNPFDYKGATSYNVELEAGETFAFYVAAATKTAFTVTVEYKAE